MESLNGLPLCFADGVEVLQSLCHSDQIHMHSVWGHFLWCDGKSFPGHYALDVSAHWNELLHRAK